MFPLFYPTQSFNAFNVTAKAEINATNLNLLPNGIYKHHFVISDDKVYPENKLNFILYLECKVHKKNFIDRL